MTEDIVVPNADVWGVATYTRITGQGDSRMIA
jgi:hypothetical protein